MPNGKLPNAPSVSDHMLNIATAVPAFGGIGLGIPRVVFGGNNFINSNYTCCEGQVVSRLFDTAPPAGGAVPLFPQVIANLVNQAGAGIGHGDIVLVVLHIHSRFDPCAKCSKVLTGLSTLMNSSAAIGLASLGGGFAALAGGLLNNLVIGNARFLIEVSSDQEYTVHLNQCSQAEESGKDANMNAVPVNISLGNPINWRAAAAPANALNQLAIPNGLVAGPAAAPGNWDFPNTFPPYTIYGRRVAGGAIQAVPAPNGHAHVGGAGGHGHAVAQANVLQ